MRVGGSLMLAGATVGMGELGSVDGVNAAPTEDSDGTISV